LGRKVVGEVLDLRHELLRLELRQAFEAQDFSARHNVQGSTIDRLHTRQ
jgi:hypothetical protein